MEQSTATEATTAAKMDTPPVAATETTVQPPPPPSEADKPKPASQEEDCDDTDPPTEDEEPASPRKAKKQKIEPKSRIVSAPALLGLYLDILQPGIRERIDNLVETDENAVNPIYLHIPNPSPDTLMIFNQAYRVMGKHSFYVIDSICDPEALASATSKCGKTIVIPHGDHIDLSALKLMWNRPVFVASLNLDHSIQLLKMKPVEDGESEEYNSEPLSRRWKSAVVAFFANSFECQENNSCTYKFSEDLLYMIKMTATFLEGNNSQRDRFDDYLRQALEIMRKYENSMDSIVIRVCKQTSELRIMYTGDS